MPRPEGSEESGSELPVLHHRRLTVYLFPCVRVALDWQEAEAIARVYDDYWKQPSRDEGGDLTPGEPGPLDALERKLDQAIQSRGGRSFLKLSGQSPKDVALFQSNSRMQAAFSANLRLVAPSDTNAQLSAFLQALNMSLCVTSGAQAVEYITRSHRIAAALRKTLRSCLSHHFQAPPPLTSHVEHVEYQGEESELLQPGGLPLEIVLRDFQEIKVEEEFRCFVYNKKLTAITQYECGLFATCLQGEDGEAFKQRLTSFVEFVLPLIYANHFVMDLAVAHASEAGFYIVEIHLWVSNLPPSGFCDF